MSIEVFSCVLRECGSIRQSAAHSNFPQVCDKYVEHQIIAWPSQLKVPKAAGSPLAELKNWSLRNSRSAQAFTECCGLPPYRTQTYHTDILIIIITIIIIICIIIVIIIINMYIYIYMCVESCVCVCVFMFIHMYESRQTHPGGFPCAEGAMLNFRLIWGDPNLGLRPGTPFATSMCNRRPPPQRGCWGKEGVQNFNIEGSCPLQSCARAKKCKTPSA